MSLTVCIEPELRRDLMDVVEDMLSAEGYAYTREGAEEIRFAAPGSWCDYQLWFTPAPEAECLHLCLTFDARLPANRRAEATQLLALVNERAAIGHFDLWAEDGTVAWRHAVLTVDLPSVDSLAMLVSLAIAAAERFYPAFNTLLWGGKSADEAVSLCMFETAGRA